MFLFVNNIIVILYSIVNKALKIIRKKLSQSKTTIHGRNDECALFTDLCVCVWGGALCVHMGDVK